MGHHLVEGGVAVLRLLNPDDLHLVELVEAVQAADILAVGTGLAAEAGRVGRQLLRELVGGEDDVTVDVRHRDLGGRDHVEVIDRGVVHLAFLVGKLAGTEAGGGIDHHRRFHLLVAGGGVAVQEEVDEGALQAGSLALIDREAGAGDLHAQVEVDDVVLSGEFPVREGVFGELGLRTAHLHDEVVLGAGSLGNEVARDVRKENKLGLEFGIVVVGLLEEVGGTGLEGGDLGLGGLGLLLLALFHQGADGGGRLFLLGEEGVGLGLEGLAVIVQGDDLLHDGAGVKVLDGEFLDHIFGIVPKKFECKHGTFSM